MKCNAISDRSRRAVIGWRFSHYGLQDPSAGFDKSRAKGFKQAGLSGFCQLLRFSDIQAEEITATRGARLSGKSFLEFNHSRVSSGLGLLVLRIRITQCKTQNHDGPSDGATSFSHPEAAAEAGCQPTGLIPAQA